MKAEAFGAIGILPKDFYEMDTDDYTLMRKGFYDNREYFEGVVRRQVQIQIAPWIKNLPSVEDLWPLSGDKERMSEQQKANGERQAAELSKHKKGGFEYRYDPERKVIVEYPLN